MNNFAEFLKNKFPALEYMDELAQKHFEEFKEYRKNIKGKKEKTINFELDMLSNLFKRLMDKDYLNYNPLSRVKRLQEPYKEERWFTEEEVRKILEAAKNEKSKINWYAIFAAYYYTGMRKRELMFFTRADIDLEKGIILVRHKEGFKPKTDRPRGYSYSSGIIANIGTVAKCHFCVIARNEVTKQSFFVVGRIDCRAPFLPACRQERGEVYDDRR